MVTLVVVDAEEAVETADEDELLVSVSPIVPVTTVGGAVDVVAVVDEDISIVVVGVVMLPTLLTSVIVADVEP